MNVPRDKRTDFFSMPRGGAISVTEYYVTVCYRDHQVIFPRTVFDRLVDWYIGTPQIVAGFAERDARIKTLKTCLLSLR